jgi:hypothetical protein
MHWRDVFDWHIRKQPGQNKAKDLRGVQVRKLFCGKIEYQTRPGDNGQPVLDPRYPVMPGIRKAHCPGRL